MKKNTSYTILLSFILLWVALCALLLTAAPVQAQVACSSPVQLSNGLSEYLYDIDDNLVVWVEEENGDADIWMHDLYTQTTTPLAVNPDYEDGFAVKNGVIALSLQTADDYEIFLYSPRAKTYTQITDNTVEEMGIYTDGTSVVWHQEDTVGLGNNVYHYNIASGVTTQITNNSNEADNFSPMVSGDTVLWNMLSDFGVEVYYRNLLTGANGRLSDSPYGESALHDVDGDGVVWVSYDGNDSEVYYHNLSTGLTKALTNNQVEDEGPIINGNYITWERFDGNDSEIMLYDIAANNVRRITNNSGNDWNSWVDGNTLVWEGENGSNFDIFALDLTDNVLTQITSSDQWDNSPRVSGEYLIWQSGIFFDPFEGDVAELFYAKCTTGKPEATPTPTSPPSGDPEELVINPGFEVVNNTGAPRMFPWRVKDSEGKDTVRCKNQPTGFARSGNCAFVFQTHDRLIRLYQDVDLSGRAFAAGDVLQFRVFVKAAHPSASVALRLRVVYNEGYNEETFKRFDGSKDYSLLSDSYTLKSGSLKRIRLVVQNTSDSGKVYVDDISMIWYKDGTGGVLAMDGAGGRGSSDAPAPLPGSSGRTSSSSSDSSGSMLIPLP